MICLIRLCMNFKVESVPLNNTGLTQCRAVSLCTHSELLNTAILCASFLHCVSCCHYLRYSFVCSTAKVCVPVTYVIIRKMSNFPHREYKWIILYFYGTFIVPNGVFPGRRQPLIFVTCRG